MIKFNIVGNSFAEDIARLVEDHCRLSDVEKQILITRILKKPTSKEYVAANRALYDMRKKEEIETANFSTKHFAEIRRSFDG